MVNMIDKVLAFFGIYVLVGKQHENQMMIDFLQRIKLQWYDKMPEKWMLSAASNSCNELR